MDWLWGDSGNDTSITSGDGTTFKPTLSSSRRQSLTVTLTDKSDEVLSAEIAQLRSELSKTRRQGAILRQHRKDDLSRTQRTLELRREDWNSLCYNVVEQRTLKPVSYTNNSNKERDETPPPSPPDYAAVIRQVFASNQDGDEDKTKYLTWFCHSEVRTLRALHHSMISKNQCEMVILQLHQMEIEMRHAIDRIREEESFVESIHLSEMCSSHSKQKQMRDTYDYYIEIQEDAIKILREQQQFNDVGEGANKIGSAARARVAENRRKREEMLKIETAKRRAKLLGHDVDENDDDDSSSMNLRVRGGKRGKDRSSSDGDKISIDDSAEGSVDEVRRRPTRRTGTSRLSRSPTPGSGDDDGRPSRRTATRRAVANGVGGTSSASPTVGRRLGGNRPAARKSGRSPMANQRREQLQGLYGSGSRTNSSSGAPPAAVKPSVMSNVDLN